MALGVQPAVHAGSLGADVPTTFVQAHLRLEHAE